MRRAGKGTSPTTGQSALMRWLTSSRLRNVRLSSAVSTDPLTLLALADFLGVSNERARQIVRDPDRYHFPKPI